MWSNFIFISIFAVTCSLTTSFDLGGAINGNRMGSVPLGMTLSTGELDVQGICTRAGVACQNCSLSVSCVPLPVGWLKVPLEECAEGYTCNAHLGKCSKKAVPECSPSAVEFEHTCEQVGIFPDAYDCRKFHLCSPPDGLPDGRPADHRIALCPRHYGYNPHTAQCSIRLENSQCSKTPVPKCKTVGQHGVLSLSNNHYYVCLNKDGVLHPQIFICPHGWHFWNDFCQPEPENKLSKAQGNKKVNGEENNYDQTSEESSNDGSDEETTTEKATTYRINSFFSTEKATTNGPDTFLADKFDLSNYETTDDMTPSNDEFVNSFENSVEFW